MSTNLRDILRMLILLPPGSKPQWNHFKEFLACIVVYYIMGLGGVRGGPQARVQSISNQSVLRLVCTNHYKTKNLLKLFAYKSLSFTNRSGNLYEINMSENLLLV